MAVLSRWPNRSRLAGGGRFVLLCCAWFLACACIAGATDFSRWTKELKITFPGYAPPAGGGPLTNFPALVVLNAGISGFGYDQFASSDGFDLRFSDATRTNEIPFEIDKWNVTAQVPARSGRAPERIGPSQSHHQRA